MSRHIIVSLILSSCFSTIIQANDFDKVCVYFEALEKVPTQKTMTHQDRNQFILKKIEQNLGPHSDATIAWEAVSYAASEQRYELYKSGAESTLKTSWECNAMKDLANITGVFE